MPLLGSFFFVRSCLWINRYLSVWWIKPFVQPCERNTPNPSHSSFVSQVTFCLFVATRAAVRLQTTTPVFSRFIVGVYTLDRNHDVVFFVSFFSRQTSFLAHPHKAAVTSMAAEKRSESILLTGSAEGEVRVWSLREHPVCRVSGFRSGGDSADGGSGSGGGVRRNARAAITQLGLFEGAGRAAALDGLVRIWDIERQASARKNGFLLISSLLMLFVVAFVCCCCCCCCCCSCCCCRCCCCRCCFCLLLLLMVLLS